MAADKIDMSHFFHVQQVRMNNLARQFEKAAERIRQIIDEYNAKVEELKKNKKS